jgi:hypothetical protein
MDANAGSLEHIFVISAFINILEAPPPADVLHKQCGKVCPLVFHV